MNMNVKKTYIPDTLSIAAFLFAALFWFALGQNVAYSQTAESEPGQRPDESIEGEITTVAPPSADPGASPEIVEKTISVMGFEIIPKGGTYAVNADANLRKGPGTEFDVIGSVKQGDYLQRIGQVEDKDWFAVAREDKEPIGFVYSGVLVPVVDGTLSEESRGVIMQNNIACEYRLRFEGKSTVEGGEFDTSDYEIRFRCAGEGGRIIFYSQMFLTEAAVKNSFHQISMDVRSIGDGMEEYLTTNFLYNPATGELRFDGHTIPKFAVPPKDAKITTKNLQEAIIETVKISVSTWTDAAWESLFSKSAN